MDVDGESDEEGADRTLQRESQARLMRPFNVHTFTAGMGISYRTNLHDPDVPKERPSLGDFEALAPL